MNIVIITIIIFNKLDLAAEPTWLLKLIKTFVTIVSAEND